MNGMFIKKDKAEILRCLLNGEMEREGGIEEAQRWSMENRGCERGRVEGRGLKSRSHTRVITCVAVVLHLHGFLLHVVDMTAGVSEWV